MSTQPTSHDRDLELHWHRFGAFHRHPDWHGHCGGRLTPPALRGAGFVTPHSCRRWHFHLPFRHRHTETGR